MLSRICCLKTLNRQYVSNFHFYLAIAYDLKCMLSFNQFVISFSDIYHLLGDESREVEGAQLHHLYTTQLLQGNG